MKKKAVFLDRDGVLTKEKSYVCNIKELEIFPYTRDCIEIIHLYDYLAIVVTNQSAIARGILSISELEKMNQVLMDEIKVDNIFYCPHDGMEEVPCECRKPKIGLVEKAIQLYDIDRENSFFIGDRVSDIETGINAGIRTVLLESGYGLQSLEKQAVFDYYYKDLKEFVYHTFH